MRSLLVLVLLGCAAAPPPVSAVGDERPRPDRGCVERPAGGEAACVTRGCTWRRPLFCSGIVEERSPPEPTQTCTCVCPEDELLCSTVP